MYVGNVSISAVQRAAMEAVVAVDLCAIQANGLHVCTLACENAGLLQALAPGVTIVAAPLFTVVSQLFKPKINRNLCYM